ncbi:MAG: hypothetical protein L0215_05760 [Gemmataceae bacterium]|nr:hypothetical protein [Gemmataceae bacterium]
MLRWTLCLAAAVCMLAPVAASADTGNPGLKSIQALAFGPDGLLIIGDGAGAQIVSVETGDKTATQWTKSQPGDIKEQLAGRLGTNANGINILKLAVNPASQTAYFAVRKLDGKQDLILTVNGQGKVNEFSLENVNYTRYTLPAGKTLLTDIAWADGQILVAAQAGETFKSTIFTINPKQPKSVAVVNTDTYHVAHGKWETNAPLRTVMPYFDQGKKYLVGAFTCTPIVKYPIDDLKADSRVKGTSVIELGNGNTPLDMFTYEKDGKTYILMNTIRMFHKKSPVGPSQYWTAKVDYTILQETEKINEDALRRVGKDVNKPLTERAVVAADYHGVVHLDRLDKSRALVVRSDDKGGFTLEVLPLP